MKSTQEITQEVRELGQWIPALRQQVGHVVVGQKYLVDRLLLGLLANGHLLLEGVPGLAKTLTVKTMAAAIQTGFQRLQFTPDLLPADLIGTLIYNPRTGEFTTKLGPIFSNLILADEINRAPAKVQSALLEAMQERQVTIGEQTYPLSDPFLVLATQNPIEQEGTYQLPEAQLDRFMFKLNIGYPQKSEERTILDLMATSAPDLRVSGVVDPKQIIAARDVVNQIYIDDRVKDYIVDVVWATREPATYNLALDGLIRYGASPRATIYLALDWNVTARLGNAFVKKFTEERELTVLLIVDVSASGNFGSAMQSKRELAAEVACLLAFSAIRNNDKVGLILFTDRVELFIPPKKGRSHTLRLIREILFFQPQGRGTEPALALDYLNKLVTRRAVVFFISDFQAPDFSRALAVSGQRHDFIAVHIRDERESVLPNIGMITLEDAETGEQIEINTADRKTRALFLDLVRGRDTELSRTLRRNNIDAIALQTGKDYLPPLRSFFKQRGRRLRVR